MSSLSRESRALLAASRHLDRLSARDKARIRGKLTQRLGTGVAVGSLLTAGVATAEAARSSLLLTIAAWAPATAKVLGVVAVVSATSAGVVAVSQPRPRPAAASIASNHVSQSVVREQRKPTNMGFQEPTNVPESNAPESNVPESNAPEEAVALPTLVAPTQVATRSLASVAPGRSPVLHGRNPGADHAVSVRAIDNSTPDPVVQLRDSLREQAAAIRTSRAALRNGDARNALAALDQALPLGEIGPLEQEALFARLAAHCLQGSTDQARRVADQFLLRFADSLLASRVRSSCAFDSGIER